MSEWERAEVNAKSCSRDSTLAYSTSLQGSRGEVNSEISKLRNTATTYKTIYITKFRVGSVHRPSEAL